jgi:WD40 repeat protein
MNKEKDKITEIQEDFQVKFEINKWEQKINPSSGKPEMIFEVDVLSEISKKKWAIFHTIEDFQSFIYNISSICLNIPEFNGFQILNKEQTSSKIIEALQNFTDYIKSISYRGDIVNSRYFIDFFGLENHFENLDKFEPKPIFHIDNLNYEVSDIVFLENSNILIISCATNFERSAMDSVKFWKKKEKAGEILIYKLNKSNSTSINKNNKENINYINVGPSHSLINSIKKETEISRLYLSPNNKYLIVGYFDGNIEIYQISDDQSAISTQVISLLIKIEVNQNKKRILGIGMNPLTNYIYTACYKDNKIGVSFIDSKNMIQSLIGGESELVGFSYLYKNNFLNDIVITLDINGRLIIGTIKNDNKNIELIFVSLNQLASISLFKVNWDYNHIYIGDKDGEIDVLNVIFQNNDIKVQRVFSASLTKDISNKAKFTKMILGNYPYKIKDVDYNPNKKELFIALHNGTIQIYSHFKNFAECVLYENIRYLNRIIFNKTKSILFTGGVEKDVYGYYIPAYYCTEMSRKLQNANLYNFMNDIKLIKNSIGKINENHKK